MCFPTFFFGLWFLLSVSLFLLTYFLLIHKTVVFPSVTLGFLMIASSSAPESVRAYSSLANWSKKCRETVGMLHDF